MDADQLIHAKLSESIPKIEFCEMDLKSVIDFFRDIAEVNIHVDWENMSCIGVDQSTIINVQLHDVQLIKAIDVVLAEASVHEPLGYSISDGVITISSREELSRHVATRLYEINDIIVNSVSQTPQYSTEVAIIDLIEFITMTIDPVSWFIAGGTVGSIQEYDGLLAITQTFENHQSIACLLTEFRNRKQRLSEAVARLRSPTERFPLFKYWRSFKSFTTGIYYWTLRAFFDSKS